VEPGKTGFADEAFKKDSKEETPVPDDLVKEVKVLRNLLSAMRAEEEKKKNQAAVEVPRNPTTKAEEPQKELRIERDETQITADEADGKKMKIRMTVADSGVSIGAKRLKAPGLPKDNESGNGD
jgi:hypothetical protein